MAQLNQKTFQRPLSVGWIPYWNLVPLKVELQRSLGPSLEFHNGHPTVVNKWLADGVVSVAPSSSICLMRNPELDVSLPLGVASDGPVQSVYLGLGRDLADFAELLRERTRAVQEIIQHGFALHGCDTRKVAQFVWQQTEATAPVLTHVLPSVMFSTASATSAALVRVLFRLWFGEAGVARLTGAATFPGLQNEKAIELVIGDEALLRRSTFAYTVDLGQAWKELTGLPFVFAVWQSPGAALPQVYRRAIIDAAELASARMKVEPSAYIPDVPVACEAGAALDLPAYWKVIQYRLAPQHMKGLALFLSLARLLLGPQADDKILVKISRWQEQVAY